MSFQIENRLYEKVSFLLLAGGKGTRMGGADKSALSYDKERDFMEKILSETERFSEIIISKNSSVPIEKLLYVETLLKKNENLNEENLSKTLIDTGGGSNHSNYSGERDVSKFENSRSIYTSSDYEESSEMEVFYHLTSIGSRTYKIVEDIFKEVGPLAGLYSGMAVSSSPYIFVTTCDTPNITKDFIEYILGYLSSDYDAVIIKDREGRVHPLCGIYKKNLFNRVKEQIEKKELKILKLFQNLNIKVLDFKYTNFNLDLILNNFNLPEDMLSLEHLKKSEKIPKIFAISGIKNSGKTTLISKIIEEIKNRGESVAVIKHDGHDFSCDISGTDTWKFREAGATGTLIFSKTTFMMSRPITESQDNEHQSISKSDVSNSKEDFDYNIKNYLEYFKDYDYIILEGFKYSTYPKFEIVRKGISSESVAERTNLLGIITDLECISNLENFEIFNLNSPTLPKKLLNFFDTLPITQLNINKE